MSTLSGWPSVERAREYVCVREREGESWSTCACWCVQVYATVCACAHLPSFFCTGMRVCLRVSVCVCVLAGACVVLRDCVCLFYILCVYLHVCMRHLRVLGKHMCIIFWFVCMCVCLRGTVCANACLPAHVQARAGLRAPVGVFFVYALCACVSVCVLQWLRMRACNRLTLACV